MSQEWRRLGIIHRPDTLKWWAVNGYCHLPTAITLGDVVRVYYSSLDIDMRGRVGYVDLDPNDLMKVKYVSPEPVLSIGAKGTFDCDGVVPSCVVPASTGMLMYYIGFQRCQTVPYMLFAGVAESEDGAAFTRLSYVPLLDRTEKEPYSRSAPFVMQDEGRKRMWYWSCTHWSDGHYNNVIMHIDGEEKPSVCITPTAPDYAVGRPWVIKEDGLYKMWYSIRRDGHPEYRMGYAESPDGLEWVLKPDAVDPFYGQGYNETAEYPCVIDSGGERWMVFNGRQHGKDGIQLAVLDAD